jgi:hypothetical protein
MVKMTMGNENATDSQGMTLQYFLYRWIERWDCNTWIYEDALAPNRRGNDPAIGLVIGRYNPIHQQAHIADLIIRRFCQYVGFFRSSKGSLWRVFTDNRFGGTV